MHLSYKPRFMRKLLAFNLLFFSVLFSGGKADDLAEAINSLNELVVTAGPTSRTLFEQTQPVSILTGGDLKLQLSPSLGETLSRLPGVNQTRFVPGASRPVIRGLDGDRIRILQNGTNVIDASASSVDHAVALEPILIDRIEVVRGPGTLLYGPNAVGGVVNVIDNRIAETAPDASVHGAFDFRYGTANGETARAGMVDFAIGPVVIHLDASRRETDDITIPGYARSARLRAIEEPEGREVRGTLPNSFTNTDSAAVGVSYVWDEGYFGVAYSGHESRYGTVAEEEVSIDLDQRRWDIRGEVRQPFAGVKSIKVRGAISDYTHTEFEGVETGTIFENEGYDARVEIAHEKWGLVEGTLGYQSQQSTFSALGDEAFLPSVESRSHSLFLFEEMDLTPVLFQAGVRYDWQSAEAFDNPAFGPDRKRDFGLWSGSVGAVYTFAKSYALSFSTTYTQRAPTYQELFAGGPHVATGAFEIGNDHLGSEDTLGFDLSLRKKEGWITGALSVFYNRVTGFISLNPNGEIEDELPVFLFESTDATFWGGEFSATLHLLEPAEEVVAETSGKESVSGNKEVLPAANGNHQLHLQLTADYVRARDDNSGESLPRIPPFRAGTELIYRNASIEARLGWQYVGEQNRTASYELPTDDYHMVNASLAYNVDLGPTNWQFYVKGTNLTNAEARVHASFLKDIAPLEGRGVLFGASLIF